VDWKIKSLFLLVLAIQTKKSSNNLLTLLFSGQVRAKAGMGELDAASAEDCPVGME
jgi:hypothetical protein